MSETIPCQQLIPWSTRLAGGEVRISSPLTNNREVEIESIVQNPDDKLAEIQTMIHLCNECKGAFAQCIFHQ